MPARIIQTNNKPFNKVEIDPITLDIIENALKNARTEMDAVLFRTAMSPGIREQHDAFPMIANGDGKMVVGQFGSFFSGFKEGYDGDIEEGDIFLTNDPYGVNGAISHLNDWLTLMPIYIDGRVVAWSAMFGHMTDIGGKVPGSLPTDAAQIFEEGIQILQDLGAEVKYPLYLENTMILKMPELEVLLHEFKHGLNRYLSELDGGLEDQPPESLEELIVFNEAHHEQVMPYFGQELFEKAQKRGSLQSEVYQDSLKECRRLSRQQGIDALMQQHGLDAFIAPTSGPAWLTDSIHGDPISIETSFTPSAVAGYPGISVPAGFVSGLPVGISFYGSAWSETILLRCAHAFENASKASKPPVLA